MEGKCICSFVRCCLITLHKHYTILIHTSNVWESLFPHCHIVQVLLSVFLAASTFLSVSVVYFCCWVVFHWASYFWLLWIKLLGIFKCKFLFRFFSLLSKYLGVELSYVKCVLIVIRNWNCFLKWLYHFIFCLQFESSSSTYISLWSVCSNVCIF